MGTLRTPDPVMVIVAAFSRLDEALEWAKGELTRAYGPIALESKPFPFSQTRYYESSMGSGLAKRFFAFRDLVLPDYLVAIKRYTNSLEENLAKEGKFPEARPLNLDPGLMSLGKFVLATTKDQAHRIYLGGGIYAEVTLRYQDGAFQLWPWTYADYRQPAVLEFLGEARSYYHQRLRETQPGHRL
jgi:hypothetical protein